MMPIDIAALSDVGRRKKNNEDYFAIFRADMPKVQLFKEGAMLCVADGLGGHTAGEIASKLAVATFRDCLQLPPPDPSITDPAEYEAKFLDILKAAMAHANENIYKTNLDLVKRGRPMGTTLITALVDRRKVYIANVGDSRGYHIREGEIIGATEDHSWVDEQVKLGLMSKEEAEKDFRRNLITRCIGTSSEVPIDTYVWHTVPGDILLLSTDGLVNMIDDADICAIFQQRNSAEEYARQLVDLANQRGGRDNITVIVSHLYPSKSFMAKVKLDRFLKRHGHTIFWTALTILIGAACFYAGWRLRNGL